MNHAQQLGRAVWALTTIALIFSNYLAGCGFRKIMPAAATANGVGSGQGLPSGTSETNNGPSEGEISPATGFKRSSVQPRWPTNFSDFPAELLQRPGTDSPLAPPVRITQVEGGLIVYQPTLHFQPEAGGGNGFNLLESNLRSFSYLAWRNGGAMASVMEAMNSAATDQQLKVRSSVLTSTADFRIRFRVWWPERTASSPPIKGLVLHQWGLNGYRFEAPLINALQAKGWVVLTHDGFTWIRPSGVRIPSGDPLMSDRDRMGSAPGSIGVFVPKESDTPQYRLDSTAAAVEVGILGAGALAAFEFDDAIGQYALAHAAALTFVQTSAKELAGKPLVVVGCSLGSLMTPALLTKLTLPVAACVMVGSGGNLLQITGSRWEDYFYSRARTGRPHALSVPASKRIALRKAYLQAATLDPLTCADALRKQPLLMIHAAWDRIVDASLGDQLWEAAGRPERWVANKGHIRLFLTLRFHADEIVDWIEDQVTDSLATSPAEAGVTSNAK